MDRNIFKGTWKEDKIKNWSVGFFFGDCELTLVVTHQFVLLHNPNTFQVLNLAATSEYSHTNDNEGHFVESERVLRTFIKWLITTYMMWNQPKVDMRVYQYISALFQRKNVDITKVSCQRRINQGISTEKPNQVINPAICKDGTNTTIILSHCLIAI